MVNDKRRIVGGGQLPNAPATYGNFLFHIDEDYARAPRTISTLFSGDSGEKGRAGTGLVCRWGNNERVSPNSKLVRDFPCICANIERWYDRHVNRAFTFWTGAKPKRPPCTRDDGFVDSWMGSRVV
jgi:hypothetical protein